MVSMPEYMTAIFGRLADAAGRGDLTGKLKTLGVPEERRVEQYAKLRRLKVFGDGPLALVDNRFVGRFCDGGEIYICLQTEGIPANDVGMIEDRFFALECYPALLDESIFLFLCHHFSDHFRPSLQNLQREAADNIVSIADDPTYIGHDIDDLVQLYNRVSIFSVSRNSILASCNEWFLAAYVATATPRFRTNLVSQDEIEAFSTLQSFLNVNPENLYFSLTSIHWRHAFLEIYKLVESVYYLPSVLKFKALYGYSSDALAISRQLRDGLRWREKEATSIINLFDLVDDEILREQTIQHTHAFSDIDVKAATSAVIGRRIYKIRNMLVHQMDYDDPTPIVIGTECWPILVSYLLAIIKNIYGNHYGDIGFTFTVGDRAEAPQAA